ncbi:DMT family transporter [Corynebacterium lubricantis]|uniref:DMT family transporter n=1 Tax=Corynebacterium lubricantis TaxID=541095 RepID=UPI0003644957|nr:DMT family transporter [Corynebacterium lubricantis]
MLAMLMGVGIGALMPIQTSVNNRLRMSVGAPLMASFISFLVGTIALVAASWVTTGRPVPDFSLTAGEPWWIFTGGALGVVVLTGNILLFPRVGSVQTVILPLSGQIFMGLAIDSFGLFGAPHIPLTWVRFFGAVAVLLGAFAAVGVFGRREAAGGGERGASVWLWRAFGLVMGACAATQVSVNGRLGTVLGSPVQAALVSFAVGTSVLFLLLLLTRTPWRGLGGAGEKNPWWMWMGGVLGATVIFGTAFLGPIVGTGMTVVLMLLGMMVSSLLIDQLGLFGGAKRRVTPIQIIGILVIVAGVAMIRLV